MIRFITFAAAIIFAGTPFTPCCRMLLLRLPRRHTIALRRYAAGCCHMMPLIYAAADRH